MVQTLNRPNMKLYRDKLESLVPKYSTEQKWLYKVDEETNEVRIRAVICWKVFNLDPKVFFIWKDREYTEIQRMNSLGIPTKTLISWHRQGVTINELMFAIRYLAKNERYTTDTSDLVKYIDRVGCRKFFISVFEGIIPLNTLVFAVDDNLLPVKRVKAKRLRPVYETVDRSLKELGINRRLAASMNAVSEYPTPSGNIDLLTSDSLIEVKSGESWKHGIGQLIAYGSHLPDRRLILYLFDYNGLDLDNVRWVCSRVNIKVMLEP